MCKKEMYWTEKEVEYLFKHYGKTPIPIIAKRLHRSVNAVTLKRQRLGLSPFLEAGEMVSFHIVMKTLCGNDGSIGYKAKSWIENRGFPVHEVKVKDCRFRMVQLSEMWDWLFENRAFVNFAAFEKGALGKEPSWVDEKRRADVRLRRRAKVTPWTPQEEAMLKSLVALQKYTYRDISLKLGRTEGAVQRRCVDLKLKGRPLRIGPHEGKWTAEDARKLRQLIQAGKKYPEIADAMGKSEKSCRGYVWRTFKTERLEKVWRMM